MIAFFTCIGFTGDFRVLKKGGALTGGPFAKRMIEKYNLKPSEEGLKYVETQKEEAQKDGVLDEALTACEPVYSAAHHSHAAGAF